MHTSGIAWYVAWAFELGPIFSYKSLSYYIIVKKVIISDSADWPARYATNVTANILKKITFRSTINIHQKCIIDNNQIIPYFWKALKLTVLEINLKDKIFTIGRKIIRALAIKLAIFLWFDCQFDCQFCIISCLL